MYPISKALQLILHRDKDGVIGRLQTPSSSFVKEVQLFRKHYYQRRVSKLSCCPVRKETTGLLHSVLLSSMPGA